MNEKQCKGIFLTARLNKAQSNRLFYAVTQTLGLSMTDQARWHPFSGHGYGWEFFEGREFPDVVKALNIVFDDKWRYQIWEIGWGHVVDVVLPGSRYWDWERTIDPNAAILTEPGVNDDGN